MPQLVSVIIEAGAASALIEDYAACLETRTEEPQVSESPDEDIGSLILRVCSLFDCLFSPDLMQLVDIGKCHTEVWGLSPKHLFLFGLVFLTSTENSGSCCHH